MPAVDSAASQERERAATQEAIEGKIEGQEARETGPAIPDQKALESFADDTKDAIDASVVASEQAAQVRIDGPAARLDLPMTDVAAARQETGLDAKLAGIQAEMALLKDQAKADIDRAAGRKEKPAEPKERPPLESLADLKEKMAQAPDRNAMLDLRAEATAALRKSVPEFGGDDAAKQIKEFNEKNKDAFKGMELTFVRSTGDTLIMVDEKGELKELKVDKENAAEALAEIKKLDAALERKGNSHDLRHEILARSEGKIKSTDAYTYATEAIPKKETKAYLDNPDNWVPERARLHDDIVAAEVQKALDLSKRMGEKNAVFALRGNTAAGKTTALKSHELFSKAINPDTKQPDGAINPDTYKATLKKAEADADGWQNATHFQTHEEGSSLARKISKAIEQTEEASMIIDKRLNEKENIEELVEMAEQGKKIKFLDVDAPLETSLVRVLGRKAGGGDPLVPFNAVAEGFEGVRTNRAALMLEAKNNPNIDTYVLYGPGPDGKPMLLAEKTPRLDKDGNQMTDSDGKPEFTIKIHDRDRVSEAVNPRKVKEEIDRLKNTVLDDAAIERLVAKEPPQMQEAVRQNLEKWKGKTFEQALDAHAKAMNITPKEYHKAAMANLEATSRTAGGRIDTSAQPGKEKLMANVSGETAAGRAKENFISAFSQAFENKDRKFDSPAQLKAFIEKIAATINKGITAEDAPLLRTAEGKIGSYTAAAEVPQAFDRYVQELYEKLNDPNQDPVELAAQAEYRIDTTDHFFTDGCGKTAKAISTFILMRAGKPLPTFTSREDYFKNAPTQRRDAAAGDAGDPQFQKFAEYYKSLMPDA